ncbi:Vanillin dehydrogenase [compost metagenome]
MQATLLDRVGSNMRLYREESFGPVAVVLRGDGDEDLLELANDSEFGLSASIFSRDVSRALALAQRVESGICHINGPTVHDEAQMPFGGVKSSGYGSFGTAAAIELSLSCAGSRFRMDRGTTRYECRSLCRTLRCRRRDQVGLFPSLDTTAILD